MPDIDELRRRLADLEKNMSIIQERVENLRDAQRKEDAFKRSMFYIVLSSFVATIAYFGKGVLDKVTFK